VKRRKGPGTRKRGFGIPESGFGKKKHQGKEERIGGRSLDPFFFLKPVACGAAAYFAGTRWRNRGSSVLIRSMMSMLSVFSTWKNRLAAEAPMAFMNFL